MYVVEKTIHSIRENKNSSLMSIAAESLLEDYKTNKELTVFSNLDFEDFYETR